MPLPPMPCLYCPPDGMPCSRCDDDSPLAEAAPAKLPKPVVAYRQSVTGIRCGTCVMYHPDGSCDLVAGPVAPDGVCDRWELPAAVVAEAVAALYGPPGVQAAATARQDALHAKHARKARTAWRKATAGLDAAALVAAFRRHALMTPAAPAPGTDHESPQARKHHKAEVRNLARSMASGFLAGANDSPDWSALAAAITGALTAAAGEGTAAALAASAAAAGYAGFAWSRAARDGQQEPDQHTVTSTLARIIAGAVTDVAAALTAGAVAGSAEAAMVTAVGAVLRKARSVTAFLDQAIATAVTGAMAAAYAALGGIELLDWVTDGGNVCPVCLGYAANGPYAPRNYPATPHPGCRCGPEPHGGLTLPLGVIAAYLQRSAA